MQRDAEGLRRLLQDHAGKARCVLRKEFGDVLHRLDLDAALSEAAHRVWELCAHAFDPGRGSLAAWFLAIARNCARSLHAEARRHALEPLTGSMLVDPSFARTVESRESMAQVERCLELLQPLQRAVLTADLAAGGTAPTAELAAELQATPNTIYVSRSSGRKQLRELLGEPPPSSRRAPVPAGRGIA